MKKLKPISRALLAIAALLLIPTFFLPIWRIELSAPQYPEGLAMQIWLNNLTGDIDIINGLNHYIGMAKLSVASFPEFGFLPYIVAVFVVLGLLAALWNRFIGLSAYFLVLILAGAAALWDFYRWGYEYGHNLSPDAAIQVPGMAYQPPIIGYKQLLNFGAYSVPDLGGWCIIVAGILVGFTWGLEMLANRKNTSLNQLAMLSGIFLTLFFSSCKAQPEPLNFGKDNCHFCKMSLADTKFGAEMVSKKGKVTKFDDVNCMIQFIKKNGIKTEEIAFLLVVDYAQTKKLIPVESAYFLHGNQVKSPMRSDVAAFENKNDKTSANAHILGKELTWKEVFDMF